MDPLDGIFTSGIAFGRNFAGLITRPYETYRRIVDHGTLWELGWISVLLAAYFSIASLVKTAAFRPFLLTREFILLASATGVTYLVALFLFWNVGQQFGGKGKLPQFALAWGYTLIPTLLWFLVTSLLYVVLPPPRTSSPQGVAFSLLFLGFSAVLFFWKAQLVYLCLRFGMRMDMKKIVGTVSIVVPLLAIYSFAMYRMGIFRVPFL